MREIKKQVETTKQSETDIFCNWKNQPDNLDLTQNFYLRVGRGLVATGHFLLIPKQHYKRFCDMPGELRDQSHRIERTLHIHLESVLGNLITIEVAGKQQTIPHAHKHFIPKCSPQYVIPSMYESWVMRKGLAYEIIDDEMLMQYNEEGYTLLEENGTRYILFDQQYGIDYNTSYRSFFHGIGSSPLSWEKLTEQEKKIDEQRRIKTRAILDKLLKQATIKL